MMMCFNEIHKFSDGTLQQIDEALDYRVKEFRINMMNPGLNTRFQTRKDVDRSKAFMFAIQKRLKTRRIFRNLKSFVGGRVRDGDYRLLKQPGYTQNYNSCPHDSPSFPQQYPCCDDCWVTHEPYQCQPKNHDYYDEQNSCYDSNSFGFDQIQTPQYTVNHPIFNAHNDILNSQNKLMEQITSMCEVVGQLIQKKQEEKQIQEDQAANTRYWKIPAYYDDDDDYNFPITPNEPVDSLSIGDKHLDTIPATESDEFIKSSVENLVPNPSESEGENSCDILACFTTFSNILFDAEYEFDSVDDQSLHNEDFQEKIFSNPLFEEEINSMRIGHHHFNAESYLIGSLLNHDSSIIPSSSKIDSLLDEFAESMLNHDSSIISSSLKINSLLDEFVGELILLKSILPGVDKTDCHPKNEIRLSQRLLYDNSYPRPPEEFNSENSNAEIESFSPSPIPNKDSDSFMEEIDLFLTPNDPMSPSIEDDEDSEGDILFLERLLHDDPIPLPDIHDFSYEVRTFLPFFTYPVTSSNLHPFENEDTIFDPGITINHFYSFKPGLSHRCGTFMKFNTHRSHLNEWRMIINGKNTPLLDV
nr:hypothetical protein [Tanacetum cinerariifolium]